MRTKVFAVLAAIVAEAALISAQAQEQAQGYFGGVMGGGGASQFLNRPFMFAIDTNGNTLITNAHNMRIFELTPDNEVVMDFVLQHLLAEELGHVGGRI